MLRQVAADQGASTTPRLAVSPLHAGLHWPLSALPAYYACAALGRDAAAPVAAFRKLAASWRQDVLACWAVWLPAEALIFGLLPLHWQVPFTAFVSFGYVSLLSAMRGSTR